MLMECNGCPVRGTHCGGCVVTALLGELSVGPPAEAGQVAGERKTGDPRHADLDARERAAVTVLATAGLIDVQVAASAYAVLDASAVHLWGGAVPHSAGWLTG